MSSIYKEKEVKPLHPELMERLMKIREKRNFVCEEWLVPRCRALLSYLKKFNIRTVVLSVSGGVDSACVLAILKRAQEMANEIPDHPFNINNKVEIRPDSGIFKGGMIIAIAQPIHSTPEIQNRAFEVAETLFGVTLNEKYCGEIPGFKFVTENQSEDHDIRVKRHNELNKDKLEPWAASMMKSYMRTVTNYTYASTNRGVVIGTGNLDEDGYLYYFCKFGDGAVDLGLIHDLHKSEVFTLARHLGVPESILIAPPSADLAPGQTDENEIGAGYDCVELVYNFVKKFTPEEQSEFLDSLCEEARKQFVSEKALIDAIHERGKHKENLNPYNLV